MAHSPATDGGFTYIPAAGFVGTDTFSYTASNGFLSSTPATVSIVARDIPEPPSITSTPPTAATEHQPYTYAVTTQDPDPGDVVTLSLDLAPTEAKFTGNTLTWTPGSTDAGPHEVTIRGTHSTGLYVTQHFTINVTAVNDPPVFTSSPVTTATQAQAYAYTVTTTHREGDAVTLSLETGPSGMAFAPNSSTLQWTPTATQIGQAFVTVRATDSGGHLSRQSFIVRVQDSNDPPSITSQPITTAVVGETYQYQVTSSDPTPSTPTRCCSRPPPAA